ncbi:MAG: S-methyl-5-thioribose-1-phosphate isomerase [SAR202 cluster bacterium Io17-Chloro-G9]|nr:MAG: S-methyl-5-thioribose-1-phosphate isomerase [SAR202 cluster bacterium Io17-Chloro-G9]
MRPIRWADETLELLDQTQLPMRQVTLTVSRYQEAVDAIREMRVRGAPAIGVTAAYAMALAARQIEAQMGSKDRQKFLTQLQACASEISSARPTAVNLAWAVQKQLALANSVENPEEIWPKLVEQAQRMQQEDEAVNRLLGEFGKDLMPDGGAVLTHCNAGALATAGYGTAVGVIRAGWEEGKRFEVYNTETRPFLQGARLTSWEFQQLGIPATLLVDSAAGMLIASGKISCVITGADRIAANGDTANKVGTYSLAVLAKENGIPFYVAAPTSTIDADVATGAEIEIEERPAEEVSYFQGNPTAPPGVAAMNPSFDVTPNRYISAIVTESGVARSPYLESLKLATTQGGG